MNFRTTKTKIGLSLLDYNVLKMYSCGETSIRFLYEKALQEPNKLRYFIQDPLHIKILQGEQMSFIRNVPRQVTPEMVSPRKTKVKYLDKEYQAKHFWEQLQQNIPKIIQNKSTLIFNLYSDLGEQGIKAGSLLYPLFRDELKKLNPRGKLNERIFSGAELEAEFKNFNDIESDVTRLARNSLIGIFGLNTIGNSEFNTNKLITLFEECSLNNCIIVCTQKTELKIKGLEHRIVNIPFSDDFSNESAFIESIMSKN